MFNRKIREKVNSIKFSCDVLINIAEDLYKLYKIQNQRLNKLEEYLSIEYVKKSSDGYMKVSKKKYYD